MSAADPVTAGADVQRDRVAIVISGHPRGAVAGALNRMVSHVMTNEARRRTMTPGRDPEAPAPQSEPGQPKRNPE